ncbi:NUDIX domain-containing protein [Aureimonas sp. Leaf324]|uniref:NUDIX domain-containing protein n=1 Tax=Aureimonas sp. Leaf324 TaxID=1736336 RepID=UPI000701017E|nr:NUDIX domain-containing protein [Aureimonas sp. Leaf324]KQQ82074.1 DNA mismatch repair protein MutT [Aureimonas sp. Leaf324]
MTPWISRPLGRLLHVWGLLTRSMTLGARIVALDGEGRVFLVRHGYREGWYMPGGAVDPGETALEAVVREALEEGNLVCEETPKLVSIHYNRRAGRDHVLVYRCDRVRQTEPRRRDWEIAESGFFALDALPDGTTPATRRRLAEVLDGVPPTQDW